MNVKGDFSRLRSNRRFHLSLQALLMVSLALGVNFLATLFFFRTDLAEPSRYSLSAETRKVLEVLEAPIEIIVTVTENVDNPRLLKRFLHDLKFLISSLEVESRFGNKISAHYVNVFKRQGTNEEIVAKYELKEHNQVLMACDGRVIDLFRFDDPAGNRNLEIQPDGPSRNTRLFAYLENMGWYGDWEEDTLGRPVPRLFRGEEMLVRAIRKISHEPENAPKAYFLYGHGEMDPASWNETRGLSKMKSLLTDLGVETDKLLLGSGKSVKRDADLVVIASPQVRLSDTEAFFLESYLRERHGSVMLLLDPIRGMEDHGLSPLLEPWGLSCDDMALVEPAVEKSNLAPYATVSYNSKNPHRIVSYLAKHDIPIWIFPQVSRGRPVFTRKKQATESVTVTNLLHSSQTSWAEGEWRLPSIADDPKRREEFTNYPGPVPYAAAVERKVRSKHGINVGGKLVVFGNSSIFCNLGLNQSGNRKLLSNTTHWLLDEEEFLDVPPKPLLRYEMSLKPEEHRSVLYHLALVPGIIALVGLSCRFFRIDL